MTLTVASALADSTNDSPDLEALFDSIVSAQQAQKFKSAPPAALAETDSIVSQVGHLTRKLHDTLRELGTNQGLEKARAAIPGACERPSYVTNVHDHAAHRALKAIDTAKRIQGSLERSASDLHATWERFFKQELSVEQFKALIENTRSFLADVPAQIQATQQPLNEITMAQHFQDLTAHVLKGVTSAAQDIQTQLLQLLVANIPAEKRAAAQASGLLNNPVINAEGHTEILINQARVDDLLQSLGF